MKNMAAAVIEAQARLNVCLRDLITFFEEAGIQKESVDKLNEFIDKHLTLDFLALVESYGKCMAFIDHDDLVSKIYTSWETFLEGLCLERKLVTKKLKALKEDKKADPNNILKQENLLSEIDDKKVNVLINCVRLKATMNVSIKEFINDPNIDFETLYKQKTAMLKSVMAFSKAK